jgi:hypothetical protein
MNPKVVLMAQAFAKAEGFGVPNALPTRCHNPGDLEVGDVGYGTDNGKTIFPNDQAGWTALEHECDLIANGLSHAGYKVTDTILQLADRYTGGDSAASWAQAVAQFLDISVTTTIEEYMEA